MYLSETCSERQQVLFVQKEHYRLHKRRSVILCLVEELRLNQIDFIH